MKSGMSHYDNYELVVQINGNPTKEYKDSSGINTYIEGRRNSEYTLFFKNNTCNKVLMIPSVDGLSTIDGKPASYDSQGYVVEPYNSVEVPGWTIDATKVGKFKFCPRGDRENKTYIEELESAGYVVDTNNQGVIGVMVFKQQYITPKYAYSDLPQTLYHQYNNFVKSDNCYSSCYNVNGSLNSTAVGQVYPEYNPKYNEIYTKVMERYRTVNTVEISNSMGTGFGEDKTFNTTSVSFKRGDLAWTGVLYYDTLTNLKKMGVIIEHTKPNAFPGISNGCFVPQSRR